MPEARSKEANERLAAMFRDYCDLVWRVIRRRGLSREEADDGTQEVFTVALRTLDAIEPGKERAFLWRTADNTALDLLSRRTRSRNRNSGLSLVVVPDPVPGPDRRVDQRRALDLLDRLLAAMPPLQREVFILRELEGMKTGAIADHLDVGYNTVRSRLLAARKFYRAWVARRQKQKVCR